MTRPTPQKLLSRRIGLTHTQIEIYHADAYYIVTYQGRPINVCQFNIYLDQARKYPKNGSPHPSQARKLADRLNRIFETEDFAITKVL